MRIVASKTGKDPDLVRSAKLYRDLWREIQAAESSALERSYILGELVQQIKDYLAKHAKGYTLAKFMHEYLQDIPPRSAQRSHQCYRQHRAHPEVEYRSVQECCRAYRREHPSSATDGGKISSTPRASGNP